MDTKDWVMLKVLAEEKNITKAAARLFISQPALTYRLKNLEEEFGSQLVNRIPSGIVFTPQGVHLLAYAEEMLVRLQKTKETVKNFEDSAAGTLRLGSSRVFSQYILPRILKNFVAEHPKIDISLKTGLSYQIVRMLEKQEISLGVVRGEHEWSGESYLLSEEPICLVSKRPVDRQHLAKLPYISYGTDTSLQKVISEWWGRNYNEPPNTMMEVSTMDTAREFVLEGLGWSILPTIGLPTATELFIQPLESAQNTPLVRKTWALYYSDALQLKTVQAILLHLKAHFPSRR